MYVCEPQGPMVTQVSVSLWQSIHHSVPCSVPLRERLNILQPPFYTACTVLVVANTHHRSQTTALTIMGSQQCFMQRPVHPSYGRVKQNVDGCLFVWTGVDG